MNANEPETTAQTVAQTNDEPELPPYEGIKLNNVRLIQTDADAIAAREALLLADAIGFDTESKPTFKKGEVSTGPHLIQLATDDMVYLFQTPDTPMSGIKLAAVKAVLESTQSVKAGFGLSDDLRRLRSKLGIESANVVDLAIALREPTEGKRKDVGAKTAVAKFFGQKLQKSKRTSTTNWANARLTERQILYAADDAHVALKIYRLWSVKQAAAQVAN